MDPRFPVTKHCIYLNHAGIAPMPAPVARTIKDFCDEAQDIGGMKYGTWMQCENKTRQLAAALLNTPAAEDIAFLKNTSEGISLLATGFDWRPGDNVVLLSGEFPSTRLPWQPLSSRDVTIREIDVSESDPEADLLMAMDERTRILVVSAVHWETGLKLDLERLGKACSDNGVVFCVDAMQWLGAMQLDVQKFNIDFLACSGHKWLMAPEGIAITCVQESLREKLALQQHGWRMFDRPFNFSKRERDPAASARRYEAGSPNTIGIFGLHAALTMAQQETGAAIESAVLDNTAFLTNQLIDVGSVEVLSPTDPVRQSGIFLFKIADLSAPKIYEAFKSARIVCAQRAGGIRLSPHFYTPREQLQTTVSEIFNLL